MIVFLVGSSSTSPIAAVFSVAFLLLFFSKITLGATCPIDGLLIVRSVGELPQDNYGRPGLSHMTVAGSVLGGMKECSRHTALRSRAAVFIVKLSRGGTSAISY